MSMATLLRPTVVLSVVSDWGNKMTKLKPCPFCGGEAYITNFDVFGGVRYVVCKGCGGRIQMPSEAEAITAWNNRTEPDNHSPTNADGFRSMTDDELAKFLKGIQSEDDTSGYIGCAHCINCGTHHADKSYVGTEYEYLYECKDCEFENGLLDWLQQPAKEAHNMSEDKILYWLYAAIDEVIDMDYRCEEAKEEHRDET